MNRREERSQQLIVPYDTPVPVGILPALRLIGVTFAESLGVRGPSGAVVFLFGTSYVCVFPVVANAISYREGNLRLLAMDCGERWLLNDTRPTFKPGIMRQSL